MWIPKWTGREFVVGVSVREGGLWQRRESDIGGARRRTVQSPQTASNSFVFVERCVLNWAGYPRNSGHWRKENVCSWNLRLTEPKIS
jgi:hypothetical protein